MRVTKVVLGLAGFLLLSLIFVSFQAAAHPAASNDGIANAREKAGVNPPLEGLLMNHDPGSHVFANQVAHSPLCGPHPPGDH